MGVAVGAKYEYKVLVGRNVVDMEECLNTYGEKGWRVTTSCSSFGDSPLVILERALK